MAIGHHGTTRGGVLLDPLGALRRQDRLGGGRDFICRDVPDGESEREKERERERQETLLDM